MSRSSVLLSLQRSHLGSQLWPRISVSGKARTQERERAVEGMTSGYAMREGRWIREKTWAVGSLLLQGLATPFLSLLR